MCGCVTVGFDPGYRLVFFARYLWSLCGRRDWALPRRLDCGCVSVGVGCGHSVIRMIAIIFDVSGTGDGVRDVLR